jgi:heptosyltransferase-2
MRILLCQLRNHGDIIRVFPLIDAIKAIHPDWYIGFTCFEDMVETCELNRNIDIVIPQPRFSPVTDTQGGTRILDCSTFKDAVQIVRRERFEVYIDLHGVFQSALFGAMCDIKTRLGRSEETSKDGATLFYTDICQIKDKELNRMERHFIVVNKLFPEIVPLQNENFLGDNIVIFPGSSKKGILKRWKTDYYIQLANRLSKSFRVVFVLGLEEQDIKSDLENKTECLVKICNSWSQIDAEISKAKLVIGNDAAYVHFSVWKSIPTIEICGPLSPVINGVWKYGIGETVFNPFRCKCQNVWNGVCDSKHECMDEITVEMVYEKAKKYL